MFWPDPLFAVLADDVFRTVRRIATVTFLRTCVRVSNYPNAVDRQSRNSSRSINGYLGISNYHKIFIHNNPEPHTGKVL